MTEIYKLKVLFLPNILYFKLFLSNDPCKCLFTNRGMIFVWVLMPLKNRNYLKCIISAEGGRYFFPSNMRINTNNILRKD